MMLPLVLFSVGCRLQGLNYHIEQVNKDIAMIKSTHARYMRCIPTAHARGRFSSAQVVALITAPQD
jgi:hypothetical protein